MSIIVGQKYTITPNFLHMILQFHWWKLSNCTLVGNEAEILLNLEKPSQNAQVASIYMLWKGLGCGLLIQVLYFDLLMLNSTAVRIEKCKNS